MKLKLYSLNYNQVNVKILHCYLWMNCTLQNQATYDPGAQTKKSCMNLTSETSNEHSFERNAFFFSHLIVSYSTCMSR